MRPSKIIPGPMPVPMPAQKTLLDPPPAPTFASASICQSSGNLRSSDIYSDDELGCRFHFLRILLCTGGAVRESLQSLETRELYIPLKKNASSRTRIRLVWQQSTASPRNTFHLRGRSARSSYAFLLVPILPQFLASACPLVANMMIGGITRAHRKGYET